MASGSESSFELVVAAFANAAAELREATLLRVDGEMRQSRAVGDWRQASPVHLSATCPPAPPAVDTTRQLYTQDLEAIESTVRALELKLRDIRAFVKREKEAIPQVEAVVEACQLQRRHLQHIARHLPTFLPSLASPPGPEPSALRELSRVEAANKQQQQTVDAQPQAAKKAKTAPRRWAPSCLASAAA